MRPRIDLSPTQRHYVLSNYKTKNYKDMATKLGVNWSWLRHIAVNRLKIRRGRLGRCCWQNKEIRLIKRYFTTRSKQEILNLLPTRSWAAIHQKALALGLLHPLEAEYKDQLLPLKLTTTEAAYIAGLIDGEGSIYMLKAGLQKKKQYLISGIMIGNTDPKMIAFVRKHCGGTLHVRQPRKRKTDQKGYHTKFYVISIRGFRVISILRALIPYLITKKKAAIVVEKYQLLRLSKGKNAPLTKKEWQTYSKWRKCCPRKGSLAWTQRYST
jgi:hypothetical protein